MTVTVLVAPSGFKECLSVKEVTEAIAKGVALALPDAVILRAPLVDGGEGTVEVLVDATGGEIHHCRVTGPMGQPIDSHFGILGGDRPRTAVIEIAAAAGLSLVPRDSRDPSKTTSYGVGELIGAALDLGVECILIGCGDSGVNDAGAGMVQALGARLLDGDGNELGFGGGELIKLDRIDVSNLHPKLRNVQIDAAVNWHNILLGKRGVARVFGPQKGASAAQVIALEAHSKTWPHASKPMLVSMLGAARAREPRVALARQSSAFSAAGCIPAMTSSCTIWNSKSSWQRPILS